MLNTETTCVGFEPCLNCNSRDNLSRWSDGHAWCFGCGFFEPGKTNFYRAETLGKASNNPRSIPEDATTSLGAKGLAWLKKYGLLNSELTNFRWSEEREWLIYLIDEGAWQARQFGPPPPGKKLQKYLTFGPVSDIVHTVGNHTDTLILTEDIVSAIKVGRQMEAMPLWGSQIPLKQLVRLQNRFKHLGLWLDKDKADESLKSSRRASQLRFDSAWSIITDLDPKEYSDTEIAHYLKRT